MKRKRDMTHAWEKVVEEAKCRACPSTELVDPAHIVARSRIGPNGGAENPLNIIPLCRLCHRQFDHGTGLDILPLLSLAEQSYVVGLVGIVEAFQRTTGERLAA